MEYKNITETSVKLLTDKQIQHLEHDILVDICDDLSGSLFLSKKHDIVKAERISRGLEEAKQLNGNFNLLGS